MFERKDVVRTLFLFVVIFVIMVTLSQILVVHKRNHHKTKSHENEKAHGMLKMLLNIETNIEAMVKKEYLPASKNEEQLQAEVYAERIKNELLELKRPDVIKNIVKSKRPLMLRGDTYSAFHERKLRYLEMNEYEFLTKLKTKHISNLKGTDDTGNKNGNKSNSRFFLIPGEHLNHNKSGNMTSQSKTKIQSRDGQEKFLSERKVAISTNNDTNLLAQQRYEDVRQSSQNVVTVRNGLKQMCPDIPEGLEGKAVISPRVPDHHADEVKFSDIQPGGYWKPLNCFARQRTAIIIPYRNRETHLHTLLHYIIPVLQRQLIEFRIFVPEQLGTMTFNKGRVMNAGFVEAWKLWTFDCAIFHDVDLLPENDKNMYTCGPFPRHMSISVDKFSYRLPYWTLVGGVFSIKREQFLRVNGYSNLYWGWGAEDDDMAYRLKESHLMIERPPANIGRYKMIKHANRETSPVKMRAYLLKTVRKRYHRDGLNTLVYRVVFTNNTKLFTHIMIDIGQPPDEAANITKLLN